MIWTPKVGLDKHLEKNLGVFIMAKLTTEDKIKIIELYKQGYGANLISKKMNIQFSRAREFILQNIL